ncbi:MAG: CoA pyrophosphatase [Pirellulaceae bacterium]|nr:CoA pyrophosphatase [Pirellulaceae bacterium]
MIPVTQTEDSGYTGEIDPVSQPVERVLRGQLWRHQRQQARMRYCPQMSYGRHFAPPSPSARPAAVMIFIHQPEPHAHWSRCSIPLTVRPDYLADHPGQISLPGGRLEANETYQQAAIREFSEELGVTPFPGRILGPLLPLWVFNSNYRLQPYVAWHTGNIDYHPCPREVARVIHLPVAELLADSAVRYGTFGRGQVRWQAGLYQLDGDQIWGATAIILAEVAAIFRGLLESE